MPKSDQHKATREMAIKGYPIALEAWVLSNEQELLSAEDIKEEISFIHKFQNPNDLAFLYMKTKLEANNYKEIFENTKKAAVEFPIAMYDVANLAETGRTGVNEADSTKYDLYVLNFDLKLAVEFYEKAADKGFQPAIDALNGKIYVPVVLALREFVKVVKAKSDANLSSKLEICMQVLDKKFHNYYVAYTCNPNLGEFLNKKTYLKDMRIELSAIVAKHFSENQEIKTAFEELMKNMDPEPAMEDLFQKAKAGDFIAQTQWVHRLSSLSEEAIREKLATLDKSSYLYFACLAALPNPNWEEIKKKLSELVTIEKPEFGYYRLALNYVLSNFAKEIKADAELLKIITDCSNEVYLNYATSCDKFKHPCSSYNYFREALQVISKNIKTRYADRDDLLKLFAEYKFSLGKNYSSENLFSSLDEIGKDDDKEELFKKATNDFYEISRWRNWNYILYSIVTPSKKDVLESKAKFEPIIADKAPTNSIRRSNALYMKAHYLKEVISSSLGNDYKGDIDNAWIYETYGEMNESLKIAAEEHDNAIAAYELAVNYEVGCTPTVGEFGVDNYDYVQAIKFYKKAAELKDQYASELLGKKLYIPIVEALTAFKTKAYKIYADNSKVLDEIDDFMKEAKSIYHIQYVSFMKGRSTEKKAYTKETASKIGELALTSFSKHRHDVLRLFGDIFFPILGLATLGIAYLLKKKFTGAYTFLGEKTKRQKMITACIEGLSAEDEKDTTDCGLGN